MGAGIAHVSIDKGYNVILKDTNSSGLYRGIGQIQTGLQNAVKRKRISRSVRLNIPRSFRQQDNIHDKINDRNGILN